MDDIALFQIALRAAVPTKPDPQIEADLVPRLARIARESGLDAGATRIAAATAATTTARRRRPRSRFALVARVGIAALMVPLLLAALAVAGVTVPHVARDAFDSVGVTLPNQPSDESSSEGGATALQKAAAAAAAHASEQGKQASAAKGANGKHLAKGKSKNSDGSQPGRRVRRHGNVGPVPGPASPPEGNANGSSHSSSSSNSNAGGGSKGKSGSAHTHTQGAVQGQGHSK
jgi:hypothetical protein